ncbi:MAG: hypothetical protein MZU97_05360 [Bacillus subtilis]|nr:hypothetical protein [Bacillus subtilis]
MAIQESAASSIQEVWCLNRNDWLVRAHQTMLKQTFADVEGDVLYYLLIDGAFQGYVAGAFKNGPFEAKAIVVLSIVQLDASREAAIRVAIETIDSSLNIANLKISRYQ